MAKPVSNNTFLASRNIFFLLPLIISLIVVGIVFTLKKQSTEIRARAATNASRCYTNKDKTTCESSCGEKTGVGLRRQCRWIDTKNRCIEDIKPCKQPLPTISPTGDEQYCATIGEEPISNFDLRNGKTNPDIKNKNCCSGLQKINKKQPQGIEHAICSQVVGVFNVICSPCGNGVCNAQYEDSCNCPEDCK